MEVITKINTMQERSDRMRRSGKTIVFVPTMGFLHEGHLSLIREGRKLGDDLVVSIFVNPTQFAPGEDFESYPQDLDRDIALIRKEKADLIFFPNQKELYSTGFQTCVSQEKLPKHLCGLSRPTFFKGVTTIVVKLFNIVKPHIAIFGKKDYQQLVIIRRMVKDLNLDIKIIGGQTVRESDGLAMSSRNSYLTPEQRPVALALFNALNKAKALLADGINDAAKIIAASSELIKSHGNTVIDYITICDPETLEDMKIIDRPALMALAVNVGKARLIDNMLLNPK
ncbi:MAG: pantoate--beta-alanine ligase [Deltaproteobacteria bacterium]|nr:pantoate--beta-alanine ligase [Deltaproteobacteria bacterium]MBW2199486.1 pantoate--beta-alanine ligase [Deltaproteobacteria bacterium]